MKTYKVIQIVQTFDSNDWRECSKFLSGKMSDSHDALKLFQYLKNNRKKLHSSSLNIEKIRLKHFPSIKSKSYTNIFSKLSLAIEEYLIYFANTKDSTNNRLTLLKELSDRGLYDQFDFTARQLEDHLNKEDKIDLFDSLNLLKLNHLRFYSDNPIKNSKGQSLLIDLEKSNEIFHQDYSKLIEISNLHLSELSLRNNTDDPTPTSNSELNNILTKILAFKKTGDDQIFQELYHLLMSQQLSISGELKSIILQVLIHQGYIQIRENVFTNAEKLLNLYKFGFDTGMLLSNNRITERRFINVISTASACGKFETAYEIIEKYSHYLLEDTKQGTVVISKAHIIFYQEKYGDLIDAIRDYPFNSFDQNTRRRWMLLCAYYKEMGDDFYFMKIQIKNYNSYFYSNKSKLSNAVYEGSLNLSKVILKMLREQDAQKISAYILSMNLLIYRVWFLKEIGR